MSSNIYSIIRCIGKDADLWIEIQYQRDCSGMYAMRKVNGNKDDQIIWFSYKHGDFGKHITEEFLLKELQRLGEGKVYTPGNVPRVDRFSGTILC